MDEKNYELNNKQEDKEPVSEPIEAVNEEQSYGFGQQPQAFDDSEENNTALEEKSEFERELENYLPTEQNTDKIKKPLPQWVWSVAASAATCIILFAIYSAFVVPRLKPAAVISYVERPAAKQEISEEALSISSINSAVSPSIVSVETKASYRNFFGLSSSTNTGSGVVLTSDGYILTSSSLVGNNGETSIILPDKSKYEAELVGSDENKDIAILKIDAQNLTAVTLGNSDEVKAGDTAIVIGNVLGGNLGTSITKGIICGVNSGVTLQNGGTINLLQTDAITNSNNAGGCLLNSEGQLVGMITYAISANVENISFAIPSNDIKNVSQSLINTGSAPEALMIGISGSDSEHGILVETVLEGSAAEKAGVKTNDLILKADDKTVKSISELNKIRDSHIKGDIIKLTVYRDGEILEINVTL